jgi:hypothetical protein
VIEKNILLDCISNACIEIQQALNEHLQNTTNFEYKVLIEKDLVLINNLKHIVKAVKDDITVDRVGASTELLLRIAANNFKHKLSMIPDKKTKCKEIMQALKDLHKNIWFFSELVET